MSRSDRMIDNEERQATIRRFRLNALVGQAVSLVTLTTALDINHHAHSTFEGTCAAVWNRLCDLIDRPIFEPEDRYCGYVDAICDSFKCLCCDTSIDVHIGEEQLKTARVSYCPNCGAKVEEQHE